MPATNGRTGPDIWVDVEDLLDYFRYNPHPSGIQRVALDIIRALLEAAPGRVRLARRTKAGTRLSETNWDAVDAMMSAPPLAEPLDPAEDQLRRSRMKRLILGLPPELRDPLFRIGILQSQVARNVRALTQVLRPPPPRPLRPMPAEAAIVDDEPEPGPASGDFYLMLGAPWSVGGAVAVLEALRSRNVRTALLLHDLIPVRRPEWFAPARVTQFRSWLEGSLRHVDHLLTISRFTAADVADYAARQGLPLAAQHVLPPGHIVLPRPGTRPAGLPLAGTYVLFVSTLETRKNHALAVKVWHRLLAEVRAGTRAAASVPQLIFAGRIGKGVADLLQQLDNSRWLNGRIRLIHEPGDAEVHALYQGCLFTILPSLFEGYGLPLGESLALGKPCLAATGTALPEAGGDLCRYFDPEDVGDTHRAVAALLDTPGAIPAWEADIRARYRPPDWSGAASAILELAA